MTLQNEIIARANSWKSETYDEQTRQEVTALLQTGGDELTDAFYKDLDFGTGGLRGIMGVGTNRINRYTLGLATQGLANYLKKQFPEENLKLAIAHDCRHNSKSFARQVGEVLAGNNIEVFLFEDLRPTPELSFAVRHLGCHSGIVITASHNPPEYNGYKVYWNDGGQLVPPHDRGVIDEVRQVKPEDVKSADKPDLIQLIGRDMDEEYLKEIRRQSLTSRGKDELKIVFTPIHGTSIVLLPAALANAGFDKVTIVEEQSMPDGSFPTVKSPNPEEAEALDMAVKKAEEIGADLVIGTDPDADRIGIAVRDPEDRMILLNGNQTAAILIYYLLENLREQGKLKSGDFIAKTIVTTDLLDDIARHYDVDCPNVLTGFKWIADIIRRKESEGRFIGGGEESYGYMIGDFVRDKDAIASGTMIAEAAAWAKSKGSSLYDLLLDIYQQFGYYHEHMVSITRKGRRGAEEIAEMMERFRDNPPSEIGGEPVVEILDYQVGVRKKIEEIAEENIELPKSNVLQFITEKGSKITARPSGTEPKIKFYFSVKGKLENKNDFNKAQKEAMERIEKMKKSLEN